MEDAPVQAGGKMARWAGLMGLAGAMLAALAAYGSGWGLWHFTTGFLGVAAGLALALIALVLGGLALIRARGWPDRGWRFGAGMAAALILSAIMGYWIDRGVRAPMIHDITTDLASPPRFAALPLRNDNLAGLKGGEGEWRALHARAYRDIVPLRLDLPPDKAFARARALVQARGWEIAAASPAQIEATATDSPFRFKDDIAIRLTPDGAATRIDMRSVSRVGLSDLGVNADRIRAFLAEMAASR